ASPAAAPGASPVAAASPATISVPPGTRLSIATGGTGGVYFPLGGGLASMLQKYLGAQATAEVTPASVDNMRLINERKSDLIAFSLGDTAYDALQGRERLKDVGPIQVRSLGIIYTNFMHLVTTEGSGISTPADLRGKRVSVGAAGSGTEIKANRVLEAYGINPAQDIQRERLGVAESAGSLKDRRLDAFFWDGGLPTGAITDLANTPGITVRLISHGEAVARMNQTYGEFYTRVSIPRDTYRGMTEDSEVAGTPNILAVHQDFSEDIAYAVLATIFDHQSEWAAIHPEGANLKLESAPLNNPVPLHGGAIRFYRDRGVYRGS
ncbi:MAG: TAXI family TRAP transporter solute-binding subunit, partial [Chloroflexota bacterium]|nr:TAXI family TRAP transporter solute-binding subunit [Chloroflexota bacterium]